jgi:hypothetical protein
VAQEILQVTSLAAAGSFTLGAGADVVSAVQLPDDDAASYITSSGNGITEYNLANTVSLAPADIINFVRIVSRFRSNTGVNTRNTAMIDLGGSFGNGTLNNYASTAFATFTDDFPLDPNGAAWTKANIDALLVGSRRTVQGIVDLTTLYIIVDYTHVVPPSPPASRDQIYFTPSESRTLTLPRESRTLALPYEKRTLNAGEDK